MNMRNFVTIVAGFIVGSAIYVAFVSGACVFTGAVLGWLSALLAAIVMMWRIARLPLE